MGIAVGQQAPAFTLHGADGRDTSLHDFLGKWVVLYFYPKDNTPGCTVEACEFTASISDFKGLGAVVIGVSPDSPESHRKFIASQALNVTLLSDPSRDTLELYGAWGRKISGGEESIGVIRSTVLVDPKGKIAHCWAHAAAKGHANEVKEQLEELQAANKVRV